MYLDIAIYSRNENVKNITCEVDMTYSCMGL